MRKEGQGRGEEGREGDVIQGKGGGVEGRGGEGVGAEHEKRARNSTFVVFGGWE